MNLRQGKQDIRSLKPLEENDQILLAHHRDDVFETILLRLFRGTGIDGLSGPDEIRSLGKGEIIRPFLHLPKIDLKNILI